MNRFDPEELRREVRELRIDQLKREVESLPGSPLFTHISGHLSLAQEEAFWRQVVAFEHMARKNTSVFDCIHRQGTPFPAPEMLDDEQLHIRLWILVTVLAHLKVYLEHTDHLSDRELYAQLWQNTLREVMVLDDGPHGFVCHIDLTGSGSSEDTELFLRYYADASERQQWAQDWPEDAMPESKPLPYDRDRLLPRPGE